MNTQEILSNAAAMDIAERSTKSSLQEKVINIDSVFNSIGVTWLNKNGSYLIGVYEKDEEGHINIRYETHKKRLTV